MLAELLHVTAVLALIRDSNLPEILFPKRCLINNTNYYVTNPLFVSIISFKSLLTKLRTLSSGLYIDIRTPNRGYSLRFTSASIKFFFMYMFHLPPFLLNFCRSLHHPDFGDPDVP